MHTGLGDGRYTFKSRFEDGPGTNPEELIGAAHAGCFSMALSGRLANAGFPPTSIDTTANVHLEKTDAGMTVTRIDLITNAVVPGMEKADFDKLAEDAKATCPISRLLSPGAEITLDATLA
jgi:osmotically inducible protein OsmC